MTESSLALPARVPITSLAASGAAVSGGSGPGPREIWRWLVLAAAALLLVEWMVFALRSRV